MYEPESGLESVPRSFTPRLQIALLFLLVLGVFLGSRVHLQSDSVWSLPTSASLLREGNLDLDEYGPAIEQLNGFAIVERKGHRYGYFPAAASWLALPFLATMDFGVRLADALPLSPHLQKQTGKWNQNVRGTGAIDISYFARVEKLIASTFVAGASVLLFIAARRRSSARTAWLVALTTAFATPFYSTASRVLWQHGPSVLVLSAIIALLTVEPRTRRWAFSLGVMAGLAYIVRPTNSVIVLLLFAWLAASVRQMDAIASYLAGGLVIAVPFITHSLITYDALLPPYFLPQRLGGGGESHFAEALAGNLISPARGLFVYSPVLLLSIVGVAMLIRRREFQSQDVILAAAPLAHWLIISSFPHWWGGHSYGPRLFTDAVPYLSWFLIPVAEEVQRSRRWLVPAAVLLAVSCAIHVRGATSYLAHEWNISPNNIDAHPERLWDWRDPAFLKRQ